MLKKKSPFVSIVIVNYNGKRYLEECLGSIFRLNYPKDRLEIILIDNGSKDGSIDLVKNEFPKVKIILNAENNYAKANNLGIRQAKGEYIALLNNDVRLDSDWLIKLIEAMKFDPKVGAAGSKVLFKDGTIQSLGHQEHPNFYWIDAGFGEQNSKQPIGQREVDSICGTSVLYRKKCLKDVGLLDEDFNMFVEDVDMSIRCKEKGWKLISCLESVVYHKLHGTIGDEKQARQWIEKNRLLLVAKHWPEKLAWALSTSQHYHNLKNPVKDLDLALSKAIIKLIKEHGIKTLENILPQLLLSLYEINNLEKKLLLNELERNISEIKEKEVSAKQKEKEIFAVIKNYELFTEKFQNLHQQLNFAEKEKKEKEAMLEDNARHLKILENELNSLKEEFSDLEKKISTCEKKLAQKDREIDRLSNNLLEEKNSVVSLERNIEFIQKELVKKDSELINAKDELKQKEKELAESYENLAEIQKDLTLSLKQGKEDSLKRNQLELLNNEISKELENKALELKKLYSSTAYKFLIRPLWKIIFPLKQFIKKMFESGKKIFSLKTIDKLHRLANLIIGVFLEKSKYIFFKKKNLFCRAYFGNLFEGTFPIMPKKLVLMLTARCNLNCTFCDIPQRNYQKKELSKEEACRIIRKISKLGVESLELTGGEALLHPDFFDVVSFANSQNLKVSLSTNGTLLKKNFSRIVNSGLSFISISVDGFEDTHNSLRSSSGLYSEIIDSVKQLQKAGIPLSINFVVTNKNVRELEPLYNFFSELKVNFSFFPVINKPHLSLSSSEDKRIFLNFVKKLKKSKSISNAMFLYYLRMFDYFSNKNLRVRCLGLSRELAIGVNGEILPCCVWDNQGRKIKSLGNVLSSDCDIETLWHSEEYRKSRLEIFKNGCSGCYNPGIIEILDLTGHNFILNTGQRQKADLQPQVNLEYQQCPKEKNISPIHVHMRLTSKCNLSCRHCDIWRNKDLKNELNCEQWKEIIAKIHSWLGNFRMDWAGGEILLRPDIAEIIKFASQKRIIINLTTNATLINKELAQKIIDSGLTSVGISLDAYDERTHNYIRNNKNAYRLLMEGAMNLRNSAGGREFSINLATVINRYNLGQLNDLVKLTNEGLFDSIIFQALDHNFGATYNPLWYKDNEFWPDNPEKLKKALDELISLKSSGYKINNSFGQLEAFKRYFLDPDFFNSGYECNSADKNFIVNEFGQVLLCWNMPPVGSLLEKSPSDIWQSSLSERRRKEIKKCRRTCRILNCNY